MELVRHDELEGGWDALVDRYADRTLFHTAAWLAHVRDIHPTARVRYARLMDGTEQVGAYCGVRIRKALLAIEGSPLGGTGTNFMGPLSNGVGDWRFMARALKAYCRRERIRHLELCPLRPDAGALEAEGFVPHAGTTHVVPLAGNEGEAWGAIRSSCRNRVRRGEKAGVEIKIATDVALADDFHACLAEVYAHQKLAVPFGPDRPRSLLRHLLPTDRVLPVRLTHEGTTIAAGIFPFDERRIYFWGGAARIQYRQLCPNEMMHWAVIKFAVARGIAEYDMCGGGSQFKDKFGGTDVPFVTYSWSNPAWLVAARQWYRAVHFAALRLRGSLRPGPERTRNGGNDDSHE